MAKEHYHVHYKGIADKGIKKTYMYEKIWETNYAAQQFVDKVIKAEDDVFTVEACQDDPFICADKPDVGKLVKHPA